MSHTRRLRSRLGFAAAGALAGAIPAAAGALAGPSAAVVAGAAAVAGLAGLAIGLARETQGRIVRLETRQRSRTDQAEAQLAALGEQVDSLPPEFAGVVNAAEARLRRSVEDQTRQRAAETQQGAERHFRQLESLLNLHALVDVRAPVPASRGWAASPDLLLAYVGEILVRRPALVVECGSGLSTLWAAYALQLCGGSGRVVALEHDPVYLGQTRSLLEAHGLADRSDVRHAPIRETKVGPDTHPWYDTDEIDDLYDIGVLLVDGPIGSLAPQSRYPAAPLFRERLSPGAAILLDDADRPEETAIAERWCAEWPELTQSRLPHEKGTILLRVPSRS